MAMGRNDGHQTSKADKALPEDLAQLIMVWEFD